MRLLVAIIKRADLVEDIMDEFYEVGIKGATIIESKGMADLMAERVPFFARFTDLGGAQSPQSRTIFALIDSDDLLRIAVNCIEKVVGDLDNPNSGVVFTIPVDFCKGLEGSKSK